MTPEQIAALQAELEALKAAKLRQDSVVETLTAEKAVLAGQVKKLEADLVVASDPKRMDSLVAARVDLEKSVAKVLGKDFVFAGKSDRAVKEAFVAKQSPTVRCDSKSDDFVDAAFAMVLAMEVPHPSMRQVREDSIPRVAPNAIADAQARNIERSANAWKGESK